MGTEVMKSGITDRLERFVEQYQTVDHSSDYDDRRTCQRFPMLESVDMMIDSCETPAEVVTASGRDISYGGMGVYVSRPLEAGTEMVVSIDKGSDRLLARGRVMHSTMSVGLFKVGLQFVV